MIERIAKSRVIGLDEEDVDWYVESDFQIRSGMCPNGHGLMTKDGGLQHCEVCKFTTNIQAELTQQ